MDLNKDITYTKIVELLTKDWAIQKIFTKKLYNEVFSEHANKLYERIALLEERIILLEKKKKEE